MATHEECEVASNAAGWDVTAEYVDAALAACGGKPREELEMEFAILYVGFEHSGCRDVELADKLDAMHIAIEVLKFREVHG